MKERIDTLLVDQGFFKSRERAKVALMEGIVFIGDERIDKAGTKVDAVFTFTHKGKSPLTFYSLDADSPGVTGTLPGETGAQKKGSIPVKVNTSSLPKGETVIMLTVTTNCPARPLINLFLTGLIQ